MDLFLLQLAVIFVPGIIWERIDTQYGRSRAKLQWDILRRTFVFGLVSYLVTFGLLWAIGRSFTPFAFARESAFLDAHAAKEIGAASLVALLCAVVWLYVTNYKILTKFLQLIGATKRYGDEDVWDFMFNSGRAEAEYAHLRDFEKKLAYAGWVEVWSESEKQRELVLRDVIVYDFEGNKLFETPRVYLARKMDNIDIEFPYRAPEGISQ